MPTVKVTFFQVTYVPATFVHFSNISAVTDPILPKRCWPKNFFPNKSFFTKFFFRPKIFLDHFPSWTLSFNVGSEPPEKGQRKYIRGVKPWKVEYFPPSQIIPDYNSNYLINHNWHWSGAILPSPQHYICGIVWQAGWGFPKTLTWFVWWSWWLYLRIYYSDNKHKNNNVNLVTFVS